MRHDTFREKKEVVTRPVLERFSKVLSFWQVWSEFRFDGTCFLISFLSVHQPAKSAGRKREVVLRLFRGDPLDEVSRDVGVEVYRLEQWRDRALEGIDVAMKERQGDPLQGELDKAMKHIGELSMEVELLRKENEQRRPFGKKRSRK